ncbi:hypothetical protein GOP47_0028499 [Adiantum capillus-veneris]|nr:hypothetical protein GOP47_0028499 [Adiantum capillus-veneris]
MSSYCYKFFYVLLSVASVDEVTTEITLKKRGRPRKYKPPTEDVKLELRGRPRKYKPPTDDVKLESQCKVGNPNCGLILGESLALGAIGVMPCDVCCAESDFCRECLCILCGKTMRCGLSAYTSVRCFARLSGAEFCGHAAHLMCALECQLAGVVKPLGLDMEYICRRCDQKTDLRGHVVRLLDSLRFTNCRFSIEKNLVTALQIIQGTKDTGAKRLVYLLQTAIQMMSKGADIRDVFDLLNGTEAEVLLD